MEKITAGGSKPNPFQKATANHVNVEEVYDAPDPMAGKLLINSCLALIYWYIVVINTKCIHG